MSFCGGSFLWLSPAGLILLLFFLAGLLLIPVGIWKTRRHRQRLEAAGQPLPPLTYPLWDFNDPRLRKTAIFVVLATVANVVVFSTATYQGVHYMESVEFCGTVCHTVMKPEHIAYQGSAHSRVACTACHIGPGASWFVKSKMSGVRQVFGVAFNTYQRPSATPVHNLRPARDTCEQCHSPGKSYNPNVRVLQKFGEDEKNTPRTTALLLKVGGELDQKGNGSGIHWWHMDPANRVSSIADEKPQIMHWVEHRNAKGEGTEYRLADSALLPQELGKLEKRVMDCIDCHNRPGHDYRLPEESVDVVLSKEQGADRPFTALHQEERRGIAEGQLHARR